MKQRSSVIALSESVLWESLHLLEWLVYHDLHMIFTWQMVWTQGYQLLELALFTAQI